MDKVKVFMEYSDYEIERRINAFLSMKPEVLDMKTSSGPNGQIVVIILYRMVGDN